MARTVNATLYTVRRDAFLDVAQRLVQTKGYEAMSIQDVLNELEASKGAFYHYFDSKQALLGSWSVSSLVSPAGRPNTRT
jgi:AcrR family transcriptional regulator